MRQAKRPQRTRLLVMERRHPTGLAIELISKVDQKDLRDLRSLQNLSWLAATRAGAFAARIEASIAAGATVEDGELAFDSGLRCAVKTDCL